MKRGMVLSIALLALILAGCGVLRGSGRVITETREVANFDAVALAGQGTLIITQGESESLTIEAEDNIVPHITTEVRGGVLTIGFDRDTWGTTIRNTRPILFHLRVRDLTRIDLSGSGDIESSGIEAEQLSISVSGSGNVDVLSVETGRLTLRLSGSGDIEIGRVVATDLDASIAGSGDIALAGRLDRQGIAISGSGSYKADGLESDEADVEVIGSGNVTVWVRNDLRISIVGSGDVNYYGRPRITQSVTGSGDVNSLGDR